MLRSEGRILTTHAGSLPRPAALTALYARRAQDEAVDADEMARLAAAATRAIVPRQLACGIDIPNNGEQTREAFFLYVRHRMSGFGGRWIRPAPRDITDHPDFQDVRQALTAIRPTVSNFEPPTAIGEVRYLDPAIIAEECEDFRQVLDELAPEVEEAFVTAPSPGIIAKAVRNDFYDSDQRYIDALADALKVEYEAIVERGFTLQLDCPDLALERHITYADRPVADFVGFVETVIAAINRSLVNLPREAVRLHVCWGNYEGPHDADVPLAEILPAILEADVGGIVLPFANPRHAHEYKLFQGGRLADDQVLVAGVIDTVTNYVEHPETVADRLERIARALDDPTRLVAGTDCGFDTSAGMGRVATDVVWSKLEALAEGARLASARLF